MRPAPIRVISSIDELNGLGENCFISLNVPYTYNGETKVGIILFYNDTEGAFYLAYRETQGPHAFSTFMADGPNGAVKYAWSVTEIGWQTFLTDFNEFMESYSGEIITYEGGYLVETNPDNYSVVFSPE